MAAPAAARPAARATALVPTALLLAGLLGLLSAVLGAPGGAGLQAQVSPPDAQLRRPGTPERLRVYAYTFRHRSAEGALEAIRPMLSQRGTVELQPGGNTLVVRDTLAALGRIVPALRRYDVPPRELRVEVMIVRAHRHRTPEAEREALEGRRGGGRGADAPVDRVEERPVPTWLIERLRGFLRWDAYTLLANAYFDTREGEEVAYEVGDSYGVGFRLGTLEEVGERRGEPVRSVKLDGFRVWRSGPGGEQRLLSATLNLQVGKPTTLGLASSESSESALMLVLLARETGSRSSGRALPDEPPKTRRDQNDSRRDGRGDGGR